MTTSDDSTAPGDALSVARARFARAEAAVKSAKQEAKAAKRRRKEAKEAGRRARKLLRRAKEELADAKRVMERAEESQPRPAIFRTVKPIVPVKLMARVTAPEDVMPARRKPRTRAVPAVVAPMAPVEADAISEAKPNGITKVTAKPVRVRRRRAAKAPVEMAPEPIAAGAVTEEAADVGSQSASHDALRRSNG